NRRDVDLELRMLAHEHAGRARMIEMNVAEQEMAHVAELQAVLLEAGLQRRLRRRRPAVEERGTIVRVEQVRRDSSLVALVVQVDQLELRHHATRSRDSESISAASSRLPQPRVSVFFSGSRSL